MEHDDIYGLIQRLDISAFYEDPSKLPPIKCINFVIFNEDDFTEEQKE